MAQAQPHLQSDTIKAGGSGRPRSILKRPKEAKKDASGLQWDEMNIIATLHPKDKDYGHMKIEEPKTPYHHDSDGEGQADMETELSEKAKNPDNFVYKEPPPSSLDIDSGSGEDELTEQDQVKRDDFKKKRKQHYNEGEYLREAREMARRSLVEDDDN